jgi:GDP-4-dehydro-6-deoxy-D-mannose reductase
MRAFVTGGMGFAGRYLIEHLCTQGDQVSFGFYPGEQTFSSIMPISGVALDVTNAQDCRRVFEEFQPEVIYHLAALAFVPEAEKNFAHTMKVNVEGTYNVLRACHDLQLSTRVIVISSSQVYGEVGPAMLPLTESMPLRPPHNYALSKAMAELVAERFLHNSSVRPLVVRAFNHIGPGQSKDFAVSSFAYQLAQISYGRAPAVLRVGNLNARRDFTDVRDIVRGYRLAAQLGTRTYNLCSGKSVAMSEILERLLKVSGLDVKVESDPSRVRATDTAEIRGSYQLAQQDLGWQPEIDLQQSLQDSYQAWRRLLE